MKDMLVCGTPNTVLKLLISQLINFYNIDFVGHTTDGCYRDIKKTLNGNCFIMDRYQLFKETNHIKFFIKVLFKKYPVVFIFGNRFYLNILFLVFYRLRGSKIVYFPSDVHNIWINDLCMKLADKLVFKGRADCKYNFYIYSNFAIKEFECHKVYQRKKTIDLVYIGGLFLGNVFCFLELAKNKDIKLHIFPSKPSFDFTGFDNIIVHERINGQKKLIQEISNFDYGLILCADTGFVGSKKVDIRYSSHMKLYDYLSAGLPILASDRYLNLSKIVKNNNIGTVVSFDDLKNLVFEKDYNVKLKNVRDFRSFFYNDDIKGLVSYIETNLS